MKVGENLYNFVLKKKLEALRYKLLIVLLFYCTNYTPATIVKSVAKLAGVA